MQMTVQTPWCRTLFLFRIWEDEPFESLIEFCIQAFVIKDQIKIIMLRKPALEESWKELESYGIDW